MSEIKKHVKTPVATLGGLNDPDMMEEIIASGKADIVEIARQSICDPYFPEKAFSGNTDDITRCCRCFTCFYNYLTNRTFCCAFNPNAEFDTQMEISIHAPRVGRDSKQSQKLSASNISTDKSVKLSP